MWLSYEIWFVGSKSDGTGRRMKEVACPICTVHLQVWIYLFPLLIFSISVCIITSSSFSVFGFVFGIFAGSGTYLRFRDHRVWSLPASISSEFVLRVQITWIRKASLMKFKNHLLYQSIAACTLMIYRLGLPYVYFLSLGLFCDH